MLYDQAQLAVAYLEAFQLTYDPFYASVRAAAKVYPPPVLHRTDRARAAAARCRPYPPRSRGTSSSTCCATCRTRPAGSTRPKMPTRTRRKAPRRKPVRSVPNLCRGFLPGPETLPPPRRHHCAALQRARSRCGRTTSCRSARTRRSCSATTTTCARAATWTRARTRTASCATRSAHAATTAAAGQAR